MSRGQAKIVMYELQGHVHPFHAALRRAQEGAREREGGGVSQTILPSTCSNRAPLWKLSIQLEKK